MKTHAGPKLVMFRYLDMFLYPDGSAGLSADSLMEMSPE